jgi:hypothetical protein
MSDSNSKLTPETFKFRHRLEFTLFNSLKRWGKGASKKRGGVVQYCLMAYFIMVCAFAGV